jgi:hypothetical protein
MTRTSRIRAEKETDPKELRRLGFLIWRFMLRVYPRGDCWEWRGARNTGGYGHFGAFGKHFYAHRFAFEVAKGPIPPDMEPDHLCRHRWCVRPTHLEVVTHLENVRRGGSAESNRARSLAQTHCRYGHPLSGDNVLLYRGARHCIACKIQRGADAYLRRKATQARPCACGCGDLTSSGQYLRGHHWRVRRRQNA